MLTEGIQGPRDTSHKSTHPGSPSLLLGTSPGDRCLGSWAWSRSGSATGKENLHSQSPMPAGHCKPTNRTYGVTELEALGVVWAVCHFRSYLYGHKCTVYTGHEALKSLLNTSHPSGKLACWGMVLQEYDVHIVYRRGKENAKADALSRYQVPEQATDGDQTMPFTLVAPIAAEVPAKDGDTLAQRQRGDPELRPIMEYLGAAVMPDDRQKAKQLILQSSEYCLLDGVLYHLGKDKSLRVVLPTQEHMVSPLEDIFGTQRCTAS